MGRDLLFVFELADDARSASMEATGDRRCDGATAQAYVFELSICKFQEPLRIPAAAMP
jgi:hypothetical protein